MAMAAVKVHWTQGTVVESPFASMGEDTTPDVSLATTRESSHDEAGITVLPSSPVRSYTCLPHCLRHSVLYAANVLASWGCQPQNPTQWMAGDNARQHRGRCQHAAAMRVRPSRRRVSPLRR